MSNEFSETIAEGDDFEADASDVDLRSTAPLAPLKAIRRHCLGCCSGSAHEVSQCVSRRCALWALRFGHRARSDDATQVAGIVAHPVEAGRLQDEIIAESRLKAIRARCLDCSGGSAPAVRACNQEGCPLHPFRLGKGNRTLSPEQREAAAERLKAFRERGAPEEIDFLAPTPLKNAR